MLPCSFVCSTSDIQEDSQVSVTEKLKLLVTCRILRSILLLYTYYIHTKIQCGFHQWEKCLSYLCDSEKLMSILDTFGKSGVIVGSCLK